MPSWFHTRPLLHRFRYRRVFMPIFVFVFILSVFGLYSRLLEVSPIRYSQGENGAVLSQAVNSVELPDTALIPVPKEAEILPKVAPADEKQEALLKPPQLLPEDEKFQIPPPKPAEGTQMTAEEISGGEPKNATVAAIRNQIREMTRHAWSSYKKYAWGHNELKPISKKGHEPSVLGTKPLGTTIVDGMDTLYMMGLTKEYEDARRYVAEELTFTKSGMVSVFEFTIRYMGGLLTAYTFTSDKILLDKAVELANHLMPAFETKTGIPKSLIDLSNGATRMFSWSTGQCAILSEAGTLHMEFTYLSELTGDPIYANKVKKIRQALLDLDRPKGLFYNYLDPNSKRWCGRSAGLSSLGDSFYEYLLKEWIRTDGADAEARAIYDLGINALYDNGVFKQSPGGHLYLGAYMNGAVGKTMDHLACFAGGMLMLGAKNQEDAWFKRGIQVTRTCNHSYASTTVQLGSESFDFTETVEGLPVKASQRFYLLRPETVESYFYAWRYTKDEAYRIAALKVVQALEKYSRTPSGYSGLNNVLSAEPGLDNTQQSFFLAETLKYLYLIFSEDSLLPLDRWVFNTEAHPFPVRNHVIVGEPRVWPKPVLEES